MLLSTVPKCVPLPSFEKYCVKTASAACFNNKFVERGQGNSQIQSEDGRIPSFMVYAQCKTAFAAIQKVRFGLVDRPETCLTTM